MGTTAGRGETMIWHSFADFWAMGGYGFYVWGSFGVCAVAMVLEPLLVNQRHKAMLLRIRRQARIAMLEKETK